VNQPAANPLIRLAPWTVAVVMAVAALWVTRQNVSLQQENSKYRTERQLAEVAFHLAQNRLTERTLFAEGMINSLGRELRRSKDLARLKVIALAAPAGKATEAQVIAVWDSEQQAGLLTMERLPAIAAAQDYQIWVFDPAYPNPVNGGVFHGATDGRVVLAFKPDQPATQATAFAISLEKKGGVPKPGGTIFLLGK
jgi:hypothetical protein